MRVASLVSSCTPDAERPTSHGGASRALIFAIAIMLLMLTPAPVRAAETITAIEIAGNTTVAAEAVRSHLKLSQGGAYDAAKVDQSIKALFATGLFAHVTIERRGTGFVVKVAENPIVARVYLEGK